MNKNLGWKLGLVFATLLFFLFGIFGIPKGFSGRSLLTSLQDRIHLGLDLKGGTHLILQVQVNDAVNGDSDRAVDRLKEDLRTRKINYTEITKPDPANAPDQILVQLPGVDDPARVKEIMQSTAMLEIKQVLGGPYTSEQEAITQQPNGILPPDSMLLKFNGIGRTSENSEEWYLVTRSSAVA